VKKNITKPTGVDNFELLTAFKVEGNTYVIFDSERVGSMGLPIIYISNFSNGKLEKIDNNSEEWQNVKNYLKGIINGANFEYIKIDNKPIFIIFDPVFDEKDSIIEFFNKMAIENGFDGVFFVETINILSKIMNK